MQKLSVEDCVRKATYFLYSGFNSPDEPSLTEEERSILSDREQTCSYGDWCGLDWNAAFIDAEKRLESFKLSPNEWLYLMAATMPPVTAGLGNQLVGNIEDTFIFEDPLFLSEEEVTALATRIRNLSYFEQLVLTYKAKQSFAAEAQKVA